MTEGVNQKCSHNQLFSGPVARQEFSADYWNNVGADDVAEMVTKFNSLNTNKAKNVILFVGDGMSLSTVVAGRIHKAQRQNPAVPGEEDFTALDEMPHSGLMKTFSGRTFWF